MILLKISSLLAGASCAVAVMLWTASYAANYIIHSGSRN